MIYKSRSMLERFAQGISFLSLSDVSVGLHDFQCWITVLSPKLLCPDTHIVNVVKACTHTHTHTHAHTHTHNPTHSNNKRSSLPPTECGRFLTSHLLMWAHDLELQHLKFPHNNDLVLEGATEGFLYI